MRWDANGLSVRTPTEQNNDVSAVHQLFFISRMNVIENKMVHLVLDFSFALPVRTVEAVVESESGFPFMIARASVNIPMNVT